MLPGCLSADDTGLVDTEPVHDDDDGDHDHDYNDDDDHDDGDYHHLLAPGGVSTAGAVTMQGGNEKNI